jgi:threonine dehydratase
MISIEAVRVAARHASDHLRETPVVQVTSNAWLKLECLQPTGSFKVRGFFAAASALSDKERARGLLTVSAGNAAAACAYVAHQLGVGCRVVTYDTAPAPKIEAVRRWGGTPTFLPRPELLAWMQRRGWESEPGAFIHPFADPAVLAGHGSLAFELLRQVPALARVVVPVGGGGLVAGVATVLKAARPEMEVIGVQSDGYPLWPRALAAGGRVDLKPETIADGTTAPYDAGMFDLLRKLVDRWLLVPEPRLRAAVAELPAVAKVVAEGAGALAYAALEQLDPGPVTVAVVSGGNLDPALLAELL